MSNLAAASWMVANTAPDKRLLTQRVPDEQLPDERWLHAPSIGALRHYAGNRLQIGAFHGLTRCRADGIWTLPVLPQSQVLRRCPKCCHATGTEDGYGSPGRVTAGRLKTWRRKLVGIDGGVA